MTLRAATGATMRVKNSTSATLLKFIFNTQEAAR